MRTKKNTKAERKLAIQEQQLANDKRIAEDLNKPWVNPNPEIKPTITTQVMDADRSQRMLLQFRCMVNALGQFGFSTDDLMCQEAPDPQPIFNAFWDNLTKHEKLLLNLCMYETVGATWLSYAGGIDSEINHEGILPLMRELIKEDDDYMAEVEADNKNFNEGLLSSKE